MFVLYKKEWMQEKPRELTIGTLNEEISMKIVL
jgi:hypothetical protein